MQINGKKYMCRNVVGIKKGNIMPKRYMYLPSKVFCFG